MTVTYVKQKLQETMRTLRKFLDSEASPKSRQFTGSGNNCEDLRWNHHAYTSHRSETIGIAELEGRSANEGTSAFLQLSGLAGKWTADSMECYCCSRSVHDLFSDVKTTQERRFGEPFSVPIIPFRSLIENHPTAAKKTSESPPDGKEGPLRVREDVDSTPIDTAHTAQCSLFTSAERIARAWLKNCTTSLCA